MFRSVPANFFAYARGLSTMFGKHQHDPVLMQSRSFANSRLTFVAPGVFDSTPGLTALFVTAAFIAARYCFRSLKDNLISDSEPDTFYPVQSQLTYLCVDCSRRRCSCPATSTGSLI